MFFLSAVFAWAAAEASVWCAVCSEEERRWLAEAVERHMAEDVVGRLREIALLMRTPLSVLEAQGITPEDIEGTDQSSTVTGWHANGDHGGRLVVLPWI